MNKNTHRLARNKSRQLNSVFTIVELLVVIVVIGILAAITVVSYTGITSKATVAIIKSDLSSASSILKSYQAIYGSYPTVLDANKCPSSPNADTSFCLKTSSTSTYSAYMSDGISFGLIEINPSGYKYKVTESTPPTPSVVSVICQAGFIAVPGSSIYGTNDFCVMKYEAKNAGGNIPTSIATGNPWVSISQTNAITYSPNVVGCTGCHLISEAEWMTIARDVMLVPSNWSGGAVGSGYIFSGHNDNDPTNILAADASDLNGYAGTNDSSGDLGVTGTMVGDTQRRTLTLTSGEVIWDFSGNVAEWTSNQVSGGQPGMSGDNYAIWVEYPAVNVNGSLPVNPFPSGTGISGAGTWNSAKGIGDLVSSPGDNTLRPYVRSGAYYDKVHAGILYLNLGSTIGSSYTDRGFRVAR